MLTHDSALRNIISGLERKCRELELELGKERNPNDVGALICSQSNVTVLFQCVEIHNYLRAVGIASTTVIADRLGIANVVCSLRGRKLRDAGWIIYNMYRGKRLWEVSNKMIAVVECGIGYLRGI